MSGLMVLWGILLLASLPAVVAFFMPPMPAWVEVMEHAQAVVVLGAGRTGKRDGYRLNTAGWQRAGAGIAEAQANGLPILFTGGPAGEHSEARLMAEAVHNYWPQAQVWLEENSANTWENAANSARMLHEKGVKRIILVTDRTQLPRALYCFRAQGIYCRPVAASQLPTPGWMPSTTALVMLLEAYYEWLALGWYWYKYHR